MEGSITNVQQSRDNKRRWGEWVTNPAWLSADIHTVWGFLKGQSSAAGAETAGPHRTEHTSQLALHGLPWQLSSQEPVCNAGDGLDPRLAKIPQEKTATTPVLVPKNSHGQEPGGLQSLGSQSQTRLSPIPPPPNPSQKCLPTPFVAFKTISLLAV